MVKFKILGLVGSPRKEANTYRLVKTALEEAATVPGAEVEIYEMAGKKINHCIGCHKCGKIFRCVFKDDLLEYMEKYLAADGIIWGAPVYHMGLPSLMKAAIDRLPNMMEPFYMKMGTDKPRYSKVCGVMTVGAHRNGGQEIALSQMINSCLLMNNIVISGMTLAGAYIGVAGYSGQMPDFLARDNVLKDDWALLGAKTTGKRVAEMTKIVAEGKAILDRNGELPQEYKYREGPYKWVLPE
jgi:multimeric flavodoxin WrbA